MVAKRETHCASAWRVAEIMRRMRTLVARGVPLSALVLACSACVGDPEARLRFEDPRMRGSLVDFDNTIVPEAFRGLWANSLVACRHSSDGVLLYVYDQMIGDMAVTRVAGYSDDGTAILVDLASPHSDARYGFYFELTLDGAHMRVTGRGEPAHTLYYKCP